MKPVSSYKGISGLSPHNILYSIYYRKAVKRRRYVLSVAWLCQNRVSRFTDPYGIVASQCAFPSPFPSAIQSLEGPYHGSPVVGLWDRAGHYSRNGIIPTGLPSFSTSVPDRQGGLYETPMSCRCTKKTACVVGCWHKTSQTEFLSTLSVVIFLTMSCFMPPNATKLLSREAEHQIPFTFINA